MLGKACAEERTHDCIEEEEEEKEKAKEKKKQNIKKIVA